LTFVRFTPLATLALQCSERSNVPQTDIWRESLRHFLGQQIFAKYAKVNYGVTMELPGTAYLYTIAVLGMTFIGFSAIVMLLRQTLGRKLRPFDVLFAHVYMEFGLIISIGAMLPPLFLFWDLSPAMAWRASSGLLGIPLLLFGLTYPARRRAASGEPTPLYVRANVAFELLISLTFLLTATGALQERSAAVFLTTLTVFLTFAVGTWLRALNLILGKKSR
jgi:hypothetical protein